MGTRPKATTNMNLSTIASLVLLAAVGTVAYDSEDSVVPYEDFAQAPEMELETFEEGDAATQFITLALYNTISQANDFEMNQWTNDAQLTQQEFGWAKKAAAAAGSAIKKGATAVYNKAKGFVLAKAGEYCRKAVKTAAEKAPGLFKKGQAMCGSTVCPAGEKFLQGYGVPASVTTPLGKVCTKACSWAVGKIGSALAAKIPDEQLADDICKKAGIEEASVVPYEDFAQVSRSDHDMTIAAMALNIDHGFNTPYPHDDSERYISAGLIQDPEFIQQMFAPMQEAKARTNLMQLDLNDAMQVKGKQKFLKAAGNLVKKGVAVVKSGVKAASAAVMKGAKTMCPIAVKFAQGKAHGVIAKGGTMCKNVLCPALVTYISGQTGGAGALLSPLLKTGCNAACTFAEKKLHEAVAKMVKDPKLPATVCNKLLGKR